MKIGIISDTHGDTLCWEKALGVFAGCELVLHAGDILNHGPFNPILPTYNPLALAHKMNEAPFPILFAKGNCDSDVDTIALEYPIQAPYALALLGGLAVVVTHGDKMDDEALVELGKRYSLSVIVSGHSHVYRLDRHGAVMLVNPGSASLPKGAGIPTVGLIEDKIAKIVDLNSGAKLLDVPL